MFWLIVGLALGLPGGYFARPTIDHWVADYEDYRRSQKPKP